MQLPDPEHSVRVGVHAGLLFDATRTRFSLPPTDRHLAILAAVLLDLGHTGAARHPRKAFDTVRELTLPGVSPEEQLIVACVTRYQQGPLPNIEHVGFGEMTTEDKHRTRRLSALVRLAAALDVSRLGYVQDVEVSPDGPGLRLRVRAVHEPAMERDRLREAAAAFTALTYVLVRVDVVVDRHAEKGRS